MTVEQTPVHGDQAEKAPGLSRLHDTDRTVSSADEDIRGRMVKDTDGTDIGKIEHLLIDDVERRVRFMEVASGGFLHVGERKSFIPTEAITRITDDAVHISHTAEHVAGAPAYNPDLVTPDLIATSADYFSNLYPYYGYQGFYSFVGPLVGYPYAKSDTTPTPRSSD